MIICHLWADTCLEKRIHYKVSDNQKKNSGFFTVILINLEGRAKNAPPPTAQDAFERLMLVGLRKQLHLNQGFSHCLMLSSNWSRQSYNNFEGPVNHSSNLFFFNTSLTDSEVNKNCIFYFLSWFQGSLLSCLYNELDKEFISTILLLHWIIYYFWYN